MKGYTIYVSSIEDNIHVYNQDTEQLDTLLYKNYYKPVKNIFDEEVYEYARFLKVIANNHRDTTKRFNLCGYELDVQTSNAEYARIEVNGAVFEYEVYYRRNKLEIKRKLDLNDYLSINNILDNTKLDLHKDFSDLINKYNFNEEFDFNEATDLISKEMYKENEIENSNLNKYNIKCYENDFTGLSLSNTEFIDTQTEIYKVHHNSCNKFMNYKIGKNENKKYLYKKINLALLPYLRNVENSISILLNKLKINSAGFALSKDDCSFDTIVCSSEYDIMTYEDKFIHLTSIADNILAYIFNGKFHKFSYDTKCNQDLKYFQGIIDLNGTGILETSRDSYGDVIFPMCGSKYYLTKGQSNEIYFSGNSSSAEHYVIHFSETLPQIRIKDIVNLLKDIRDNSYDLYKVLEHIARKDVFTLLKNLMKPNGSSSIAKFKDKFNRLPLYKEVFYKTLLEQDQLLGNLYKADFNEDIVYDTKQQNEGDVCTTNVSMGEIQTLYTTGYLGQCFNKHFNDYNIVKNEDYIFEDYTSDIVNENSELSLTEDNVLKLNNKGLVYHIMTCLDNEVGLSKPSESLMNLINSTIEQYESIEYLGLEEEDKEISLKDFIKAVESNLESYGDYEEELCFDFKESCPHYKRCLSKLESIFEEDKFYV